MNREPALPKIVLPPTVQSIPSRADVLTIEQVCDFAGLAESTIYHMVAAGRFPKPIKIGRRNHWRLANLETFFRRLDAKENPWIDFVSKQSPSEA